MRPDLQKDIDTAVRILRDAGATEVYLFGSVARGTRRPESDIDLAVRGIPPRDFYRTVGSLLMALSTEFDLVDLDVRNPFTEYLERKGNLVRVA